MSARIRRSCCGTSTVGSAGPRAEVAVTGSACGTPDAWLPPMGQRLARVLMPAAWLGRAPFRECGRRRRAYGRARRVRTPWLGKRPRPESWCCASLTTETGDLEAWGSPSRRSLSSPCTKGPRHPPGLPIDKRQSVRRGKQRPRLTGDNLGEQIVEIVNCRSQPQRKSRGLSGGLIGA
jgi:hypothetical protein